MIKINTPGLAGRLAIVTGVLVTLAVGSMLVFGVRSLRSLAEAEAMTRVELAVSAAREGLRQSTEDLLTAARILGERPPLQRLLRGAIRDALPPYLVRYCDGAALDACGIVQRGELLASTSPELDWPAILAAASEQGERFLVTGAAASTAIAGAQAPVVDHEGVNVLTLRRMDARLAERLSERAGVEVQPGFPCGSILLPAKRSLRRPTGAMRWTQFRLLRNGSTGLPSVSAPCPRPSCSGPARYIPLRGVIHRLKHVETGRTVRLD